MQQLVSARRRNDPLAVLSAREPAPRALTCGLCDAHLVTPPLSSQPTSTWTFTTLSWPQSPPTLTGCRSAMNAINGQLWVSERFAIDYVQLTPGFRLFTGDPTKLESYAYFGAPIHAVADGKVVTVVDNLPEQLPSKSPTGLPLNQYGGNHIVQDIGDANYAFYAHLKSGGITVKPGDDLKTGQTIAAVGNSGNSDAPPLHFHIMNGPKPLVSNGLPFMIKSFRLDQRIASERDVDKLFTAQPARLQPGFAARDQTEVSPLSLDIMNYSVGQ